MAWAHLDDQAQRAIRQEPCWLCKLVPPFFWTCAICGTTDLPERERAGSSDMGGER